LSYYSSAAPSRVAERARSKARGTHASGRRGIAAMRQKPLPFSAVCGMSARGETICKGSDVVFEQQ
jgi:hypothetical protein